MNFKQMLLPTFFIFFFLNKYLKFWAKNYPSFAWWNLKHHRIEACICSSVGHFIVLCWNWGILEWRIYKGHRTRKSFFSDLSVTDKTRVPVCSLKHLYALHWIINGYWKGLSTWTQVLQRDTNWKTIDIMTL